MGIYHSQAYTIEKITRKLSYKNRICFNADTIDVHPLTAIQFCIMQLLSFTHSNHHRKINRLCKVSDEIYCVIGNKQLCDPFEFDFIDEDSIIKGMNNQEYLDNLIKFLKKESGVF